MERTHPAIRASFRQARQTARARHRDIAQALGISEGELVAAHGGPFDAAESPLKARRLQPQWPEIVAALEPLGELMALTRNESCVHEKVGVYRHASVNGHVGLVLGGAIDLRVFYSQWAHGFAVKELLADGAVQRSLQFFDAQGQALHKVFLRAGSDEAAYEALVARFAAQQDVPGMLVAVPRARVAEQPDAAINVAGWRDAWASMRDTHEFFGLMKRFSVTRTQGLRLASPEFVQSVPTDRKSVV